MKLPLYIALLTGVVHGLTPTENARCTAEASRCDSTLQSTMTEIIIKNSGPKTASRLQQECNAVQAYRECLNRRVDCPSTETDSRIPLKGFNVTCMALGRNSLTRPTSDPCADNEYKCGTQMLESMLKFIEDNPVPRYRNDREFECTTVSAYRQCLNHRRGECPYTEAEFQKRLKNYDVTCTAAGLSSLTSTVLISLLTAIATWIMK